MGCKILWWVDQGFWYTFRRLCSPATYAHRRGSDDPRALYGVRELVQHHHWCDLHVHRYMGWNPLCWSSRRGALPVCQWSPSHFKLETCITPTGVRHSCASHHNRKLCLEALLCRFLLCGFCCKNTINAGNASGARIRHSYLQWCKLIETSGLRSSRGHAPRHNFEWHGLCKAIASEASSQSCFWDSAGESFVQCSCMGSSQRHNCLVGSAGHSYSGPTRCEADAQYKSDGAFEAFKCFSWHQEKRNNFATESLATFWHALWAI